MTMDTFEKQLIEQLPRMRAYAMLLTHNRTQAEDITQEAALKVLAARESFEPGTNFKAWTYRILRNVFLDGARKAGRETSSDEALFEQIPSPATPADDLIMLREMLAALDVLPLEQKECLLLVYAEGLQYDEVAQIQGCSVGTVKSRVFRAKQYLEDVASAEVKNGKAPRSIRKRAAKPTDAPGSSDPETT